MRQSDGIEIARMSSVSILVNTSPWEVAFAVCNARLLSNTKNTLALDTFRRNEIFIHHCRSAIESNAACGRMGNVSRSFYRSHHCIFVLKIFTIFLLRRWPTISTWLMVWANKKLHASSILRQVRLIWVSLLSSEWRTTESHNYIFAYKSEQQKSMIIVSVYGTRPHIVFGAFSEWKSTMSWHLKDSNAP